MAPTLAGLTRDHTGGFTPFFIGLSVLVALVLFLLGELARATFWRRIP